MFISVVEKFPLACYPSFNIEKLFLISLIMTDTERKFRVK